MQRNDVEDGSKLMEQWDAVETVEDAQTLMNAIEYSPQQVAGASSGSTVTPKDNDIQGRMAKLGIPGIEFTEGK